MVEKKKKKASGARLKCTYPCTLCIKKCGFFPSSNRKNSVAFLFVVVKTDQTEIIFLTAYRIKFKFDINSNSLMRSLNLAQYIIMPVVVQLSLH